MGRPHERGKGQIITLSCGHSVYLVSKPSVTLETESLSVQPMHARSARYSIYIRCILLTEPVLLLQTEVEGVNKSKVFCGRHKWKPLPSSLSRLISLGFVSALARACPPLALGSPIHNPKSISATKRRFTPPAPLDTVALVSPTKRWHHLRRQCLLNSVVFCQHNIM